ncbi:MAG: hypothetical protein J6T01_01780, partial [Kiritimatiellae bacterium]|nr:hypothetical protein [Kiritimatiellia bacterium]
LQRVVREARRFVGAGGARVKLAGREPSGASLRVEALYALDESARPVALLKGGRFPGGRWKYPYFNAGGCGAFVFDVTGDGSGRTVVFTVKSPREFTAAVSEHRVKIDFTGRRRIAVFLRERDAVSIPSLSTRYSVFRNPLAAGHISEVSFAWDGGADAPPLEIGGVFACRVRRAAADRPEISVAGSRLQVPFALESGESAELENGEWTHYAENGDPVRRVKGPALTLPAGVNDIVWHSAARAEITLTAFREKIDAVAVGAATPEFDYLLPLRHEPEKGFEAKAAVPVAPGERRRLRLEILGRALRPVLTAGGRRSEFPVEMKDGDRLLCRDGRHWLLRDSRRRVLAEGEMELPLLDRPCEVSLTDSAPGRAAASVLVSTQRIR